ncbi:MAG: polysaccharide deacetylase family protein [Acidimicrobiales bacterium]
MLIQCALCCLLIGAIASMGADARPASGAPPDTSLYDQWDGGPAPTATPVAFAASTGGPAFLPEELIPSTTVAAPPSTVAPATPVVPPATAAGDPCAPTRPLIAPVMIKTGPQDRKRVAVTIDDTFGASGARNVASVLDLAKAKGAKLTFFPTGGAFDDHQKAGLTSVWKRALDEGHEIGNHTYTHWNLLKLNEKDIQDELDSTQGRLDQILGFHYDMHLMRPPGGNGGYPDIRPDPNGPRVRCEVQRLGYSMTMWSIDSNGTGGFTDYLNRLTNTNVVTNGSIILLHFTTFSVNNVSALLDNLNKRGFEMVTVSQLFARV